MRVFERVEGLLERRYLEQRTDLGLVAQQHVDVVGDEIQEITTVPIDAEHVDNDKATMES